MKRGAMAALLCLALGGCAEEGFTEDPRHLRDIPGASLTQAFGGHYPCLPEHPASCQRLKVWLVLYTDDKTGTPAAYQFGYLYVGTGNKRNIWEGKWSVRPGPPGRPGQMISLDDQAPATYRRHWLVDDKLLLTLDEKGKVRQGSAIEAYALAKLKEIPKRSK